MSLSAEGRASLDGTWIPVAAQLSGQELPVAELRVARFVIEHATYCIVDRRSNVLDRGELRFDGAAVPSRLDIIGVEGPYAGRRMLAIVELDADRLRICYDLERQERPQCMEAAEDQLLLSITYVRAPPALNA